MKKQPWILTLAAILFAIAGSRADILLFADPDYPAGASVFTVDPDLHSPAARNVAATRQLRQTFQLDSTIQVAEIVTSLAVQSGGVNGGLIIDIHEVEDVNASSWAPGSLVHSFTIPTTTTLPVSSTRLGFTFSGGDIFTLPQRNSGTQGYGFELSNADDTTNVGAWRHSNDGINSYLEGIYYSETGSPPNLARDMGLAILAIPEPSVPLLALAGLGLMSLCHRRSQT